MYEEVPKVHVHEQVWEGKLASSLFTVQQGEEEKREIRPERWEFKNRGSAMVSNEAGKRQFSYVT